MNNNEFATGCLSALIIVLMIVGGIAGLSLIHYDPTRGGQHNGYVTAIEQGGIIYHNWSIYFKTDNSSSQEDLYCVMENDTELVKQLKEFNKNKTPVVINYEGVRGLGWDLCGPQRITSVKEDVR